MSGLPCPVCGLSEEEFGRNWGEPNLKHAIHLLHEERDRAEKAERERDERRAAQSHALKLIELRTQERDVAVRERDRLLSTASDYSLLDLKSFREAEARRLRELLKGEK